MIHFDLHMHSNQSGDGQFTPAELVQMLKQANIQVAALSDHDTVKGVTDMMAEGKKRRNTNHTRHRMFYLIRRL